jgi:hypothetical protein
VLALAWTLLVTVGVQNPTSSDAGNPDELYRQRQDLASVTRAADLWTPRASTEYEAAWKLARACYWLGKHAPESARRDWLRRGVTAGETATRLGPDRPEGHFWLAADMGTLAESFGLLQGIKYRGRVKEELERVIVIRPGWQDGSAEAALGQWYFEVPHMFGGSRAKAEESLRRALEYGPSNTSTLLFLADLLAADGRRDEARTLLQRVLDAPFNPEWAPEDAEFKKKAAARLEALGGARQR